MKDVQTETAMESTRVRRAWGLSIAVILCVLLIDQALKIYVKTHFALYESVEVTSWFHLDFIENKGMAFGMDFVGTMALTLFRIVAIGCFLWLLRSHIRGRSANGFLICLSLVIAGACGNIFDNVFYGLVFSNSEMWQVATFVPFGEGYGPFMSGKVVDMFYFPLFVWPDWVPGVGGLVFFNAIFNFAEVELVRA